MHYGTLYTRSVGRSGVANSANGGMCATSGCTIVITSSLCLSAALLPPVCHCANFNERNERVSSVKIETRTALRRAATSLGARLFARATNIKDLLCSTWKTHSTKQYITYPNTFPIPRHSAITICASLSGVIVSTFNDVVAVWSAALYSLNARVARQCHSASVPSFTSLVS